MRWWALLVMVAIPASANEFAFEVGGGVFTPLRGLSAASIDGALEGRFPFAHGGSLDLRARVFANPVVSSGLSFGHTALMRYRTPRFGGDTVSFNFAAGVGLCLFYGVVGGDVGLIWPGGAMELSPTLDVKISEAVRFYVAMNLTIAMVVPGYAFGTGGFSFGFVFDVTKSHQPPVSETVIIPASTPATAPSP